MLETLLFFVAVLAASVVVMWCERNRLERQIATVLEELATERSTVSRQMIELAEVKAYKISEVEQLRDAYFDLTKERDQVKKDYDYVRNALWEECETSHSLRLSRAIIIDHCRKLKRELSHERATHKLTADSDRDMVDNMKKERDHARKLMDETRERCGSEMDVLVDTIRDLEREKAIEENRAKQLLAQNKSLASVCMSLRQSRQKIIDHCRMLKRSQTYLRHLTDYILDELTTINTNG